MSAPNNPDPGRRSPLSEAFAMQAGSCERLGSPFTSRLCRLFVDRRPSDAGLSRMLDEWPGDPSYLTDAVPLRVTGALHAMVLEGLDSDLAAVYPPNRPPEEDDNLWEAIDGALTRHAAFVRERLESPPQTNEVRRSVAIWPGLAYVAGRFGLPLNLLEVGASAGLNLVCDQYAYRFADTRSGKEGSSVILAPEWQGTDPPAARPVVAARAGCDLRPLDPHDPGDCLRLLSYLWPDQIERIERTEAALEITRRHGVTIEAADAVTWLERQLAARPEGKTTALFHSIAWQYFDPDDQIAGERLMMAAGRTASAEMPLAWLRMEAEGGSPGAALSVTVWPSGETIELGRADFHGRWIRWAA